MSQRHVPVLDDSDVAILALLQEDARTTNADIGRQVGLVPSAIFQRLRKLERRGVILRHETRIDAHSVGLGLAAFVFVKLDEPLGSHEAARRLAEIPEVQELHHVAGEDCYLLKVRVRDTQALGEFLREQLGRLDSLESTRTTIVLETLKETARLPLPRPQ
jgi:Lrp/AsnC family leucine-responsive transcriptional regulator